jgi:hypothetical protein
VLLGPPNAASAKADAMGKVMAEKRMVLDLVEA